MQFTQIENLIRIDFQYDSKTVAGVKALPGARFQKDVTGAYWTIPSENLKYVFDRFPLTPGFLFPGCKNFLNPDYFGNLKVSIKENKIKIEGEKSAWLSQSILDLCSIEYSGKRTEGKRSINVVYNETVAEEIYAKNNIVVVQFPPGLYWRILDFIKIFNFDITVDPYPKSPALNPKPIKITPRFYQQKTTDMILSGEIKNRATLVMATAGGKTILSVMIAAALGLNTIFYTYSTDLLDQTAEVYENLFGTKIGRISGEYFDIQPITIATVQAVYSCQERQDERWEPISEYLNTVDLMFIDEGHMLGAKTIFTISQITNAYYSYALTATPEREDGKELLIEAGTGPAVNLISEDELIKGGHVLPIEVNIYQVPRVRNKAKTYNTQYKKQIVNNNFRNKLIADIAERYQDRQTIILVKEIPHGKNLKELISAPFIHGTSKNRKEVLAAFKSKEIKTIIASNILKQGIDLPGAEVLILAHGGSGKVELQQKIGRIRRPAPEKEVGIVIDFYDSPEQNDVFSQQAEKRIAFYKSKNFNVYFMSELDTSLVSC